MFSFKRLFILLLISVSIAVSPALSNDTIDTVLKQGLIDGDIPGVVAMAANSEGVIYRGTFGQSDRASNKPMEEDNLFRIASMTKPITTVAVMQLVEQGKIDLDRDVSDYLPRLANLQVLEGFDENDKPILRPAKAIMTTRQLLSHTSGFTYAIFNEEARRYQELAKLDTALDPGDGFLSNPLIYDPGTKWEYSIGIDWAGVLVEKVSGLSLANYFSKNIFEPLKMHQSHFNITKEQKTRLVALYNKSEDDSQVPTEAMEQNPFFSGGGGLISTAPDYIRFMRAILNGGILDGERILNKQTIDEMAKNNIGELEANDSGAKFGLGFIIENNPDSNGRSLGSISWGGLFNTKFWIDRENDICAVLMVQTLPNGDEGVQQLLSNFEQSVYSAE